MDEKSCNLFLNQQKIRIQLHVQMMYAQEGKKGWEVLLGECSLEDESSHESLDGNCLAFNPFDIKYLVEQKKMGMPE